MLILAYHSIDPERRDALAVHPDVFCAQLDWVQCRYDVVPLRDLVEARLGGADHRRLAALTFDDGLRDNYTHLFPILRERRLPAAVFLALDFIGTGRLFEGENMKRDAALRDDHRRGMEWPQVEEMRDSGLITFGSHTFSHSRLPRLDPAQQQREIDGSRRFLRERLGVEVDFFCYPFGDFDAASKRAVAAAGYRAAVVTRRSLAGEDAFTLRRVGVYGHNSLRDVRLKANPLVRRLRSWWRR
jgi:peptidoglycan/xylan/chitin deacetylase (PgdA/CDA1 family)